VGLLFASERVRQIGSGTLWLGPISVINSHAASKPVHFHLGKPQLLLSPFIARIDSTVMSGTEMHQKGTADGWHGVISKDGPFPPEKGRYLLYIGLELSISP
jgi:hypothetical protein